jgi:hypothetical protein
VLRWFSFISFILLLACESESKNTELPEFDPAIVNFSVKVECKNNSDAGYALAAVFSGNSPDTSYAFIPLHGPLGKSSFVAGKLGRQTLQIKCFNRDDRLLKTYVKEINFLPGDALQTIAMNFDNELVAQISYKRQRTTVLDSMLVRYYAFNQYNRYDFMHNAFTINLDVGFGPDRFGNPNSSVEFNGKRSLLIIPYSADIDFDARKQSYTVSFWLKAEADGHGFILSKQNSRDKRSPYLFALGPYGRVGFIIQQGDFIFQSGDKYRGARCYAKFNNYYGRWVLITGTYNHTANIMRFYLNDKQADEQKVDFNFNTSNTHPIIMGGYLEYNNVNYRFTGSVDDLRIYSRALPLEEILQLYNRDKTSE